MSQVIQFNMQRSSIGSTEASEVVSRHFRGVFRDHCHGEASMSRSAVQFSRLCQDYVQPLLAGDRQGCRRFIDETLSTGVSATDLLNHLIWPTMELLQSLYREDRVTIGSLNLATRLNRSITDQLCAKLPTSPSRDRKVLIFCGDDEPEELGGQICADLFESDGYTVKFAGGGVPEDEVLQLLGDERPDLLVLFGTLPSGVPAVRRLIDYLREVNSCPEMQIMCCGGIYRRAEGLAEEIGADLFAPDAATAVTIANDHPGRKATVDQQTVGRMRRIRKAAARKLERGEKPESHPDGENDAVQAA
jgi:methanogenic corrinoid protein MtbC1